MQRATHDDTSRHGEYRYDPVKRIAYGPGVADSEGSVAMVESVRVMQSLKMTPYNELVV